MEQPEHSAVIVAQVSGPDPEGLFDYACPVAGCAYPDRRGRHFISARFAAAGAYQHRIRCHPKLPR